MALVALADIKTYMGIPPGNTAQDAILTILQESVEESVRIYTEQNFEPNIVTNEILDGTQSDVIVPKHFPIISVESVYIGAIGSDITGVQLDPSLYYFDEGSITLVGYDTPFYRGSVRVNYTWGYETVPANVKEAVYLAVKAKAQRRARNTEDISSRSKENETESYNTGTRNSSAWDNLTGLPRSVVAMLQSYRTIEFPNVNMAQRNR